MLWIEVSISTTSAGVDPVCDRLDAIGITELAVEDESDFLSFLENNRKRWDFVDEKLMAYFRGRSIVKFYVRDNEAAAPRIRDAEEAMQSLAALFPVGHLGSLEFSTRTVDEDEWAESWKKYFKPIPVEDGLVICPEWENIADYPEFAGRKVLRINPGMLFGSGSHDTTMLCLSELCRTVQGGEQVLDLGCGSGILAIAALLLGAGKAWACDIDPAAEKIVGENAALNRITPEELPTLVGDITLDGAVRRSLFSRQYNIILSNIVADVLIALCPHIPALLAPGAVWVTSGIIDTRLSDVETAFTAAGLRIREVKTSKGWCCVICEK